MCAKAIGNGDFGEPISTPNAPLVLSAPGSMCSATFIQIGKPTSSNNCAQFTKEEAWNLIKYMQTRFFRCLLDCLKITQDVNPAKFAFVPVQNFSSQSDIDWTKPLNEIDEQLFKKYQLSNDEINFINDNVQSQGNYYATLPKNFDLSQNKQ